MRLAPLLPLLLAGCTTAAYFRQASDCPPGYVPVDTGGGEFRGRAMSAGGVVVGIRERPNAQEGNLDFWTEVVKRDLAEGQGYAHKSSRDLRRGRALLFVTPRERNTAYTVMLFVTPERITTVEVAGPQAEFDRDFPAIEAHLGRLGLD